MVAISYDLRPTAAIEIVPSIQCIRSLQTLQLIVARRGVCNILELKEGMSGTVMLEDGTGCRAIFYFIFFCDHQCYAGLDQLCTDATQQSFQLVPSLHSSNVLPRGRAFSGTLALDGLGNLLSSHVYSAWPWGKQSPRKHSCPVGDESQLINASACFGHTDSSDIFHKVLRRSWEVKHQPPTP